MEEKRNLAILIGLKLQVSSSTMGVTIQLYSRKFLAVPLATGPKWFSGSIKKSLKRDQ